MAITVTTRSGKGSPLTQSEMDSNLTSLARSATETQEGHIEIATEAETVARSDMTKAVVPGNLDAVISDWYETETSESTGSAGKMVFPNGLIMQWGRKSTSSENTTVTFPTSFTNSSSINVQISLTSRNDYFGYVNSITTSSFRVTQALEPGNFNWFAIGF